jgi:hypothetical protein
LHAYVENQNILGAPIFHSTRIGSSVGKKEATVKTQIQSVPLFSSLEAEELTEKLMMDTFKPGDKVRLKKISNTWIVREETVMTIVELLDIPSGEPGARCRWLDHGTGHAFENVFPLSSLTAC